MTCESRDCFYPLIYIRKRHGCCVHRCYYFHLSLQPTSTLFLSVPFFRPPSTHPPPRCLLGTACMPLLFSYQLFPRSIFCHLPADSFSSLLLPPPPPVFLSHRFTFHTSPHPRSFPLHCEISLGGGRLFKSTLKLSKALI